jgi:predicted ATPase
VNREKELRQISEAVETFQDEQRLLRTPIIEFSGVQGIGKTTLLQQVKAICDNKSMTCIIGNAKQMTSHDFDRVESLIKEEPVTIILDSLDTVDNAQFQVIETRMSELLENSRLFIVLASRNVQKFERIRSIARKLTIYPLEPLKRESCLSYLNHFAHTIPPETREIILDWTRGYPLAMQVMTHAILKERLDPTKEQNRRQLLRILMEEVIEKRLVTIHEY